MRSCSANPEVMIWKCRECIVGILSQLRGVPRPTIFKNERAEVGAATSRDFSRLFGFVFTYEMDAEKAAP